MSTPAAVARNAAAIRNLAARLEQWRPVVGYEGRYQVSDQGRVWSNFHGGRMLRPGRNAAGYWSVQLCQDGAARSRPVHQLVAAAFCRKRPGQTIVRHLDGSRANNTASNLAWGTLSDNTLDAVRHGTHKDARKTHCAKGHEFTPENTGSARGGKKRTCRACGREWSRVWKAKRRAA